MYEEKKWIWQHQEYPDFKFDRSLLSHLLCDVSRKNGKLEGILATLDKRDSNFLELEASTEEIVGSSQIEGELLNRDSVRSSILKKLDRLTDTKDNSTDHTDGLVAMFLDSSSNHESLTKERLFGWHNVLFPSGYSGLYKIDVAMYRKEEISVVSQKNAKEKVHYTAPPPNAVPKEMETFLHFINTNKDDPYIKASIAHLWFLTIHPFDDGNGRIARAITNYILSKELQIQHSYYSISTVIAHDKKSYYDMLENTQKLLKNKDLNILKWIEWHTKMIGDAIDRSLEHVKKVLDKTLFWDKARRYTLNQRQIKVLNKLLDAREDGFEGGLSAKKYLSMTKTSLATAKRDISDLVEKGLIVKFEGSAGRNTRYVLNLEIT